MNAHGARRFFEDFHVGQTILLGEWVLTHADVEAFADVFLRPDTIVEQAEHHSHGAIVPPLLTACILTRLMGDSFLVNSSSMGSPGVDHMDWPEPFRVGERLIGRSIVLGARISRTRPIMGLVRFRHEALHEAGSVGLQMTNPIMFARRSSHFEETPAKGEAGSGLE